MMQGKWTPAPNKEAEELLALIHSTELPLEGVCLHGNENDKPVPSRKALAALHNSSIDIDALAGVLFMLIHSVNRTFLFYH